MLNDIDRLAERMAETYTNGNWSEVAKTVNELPPMAAAAVVTRAVAFLASSGQKNGAAKLMASMCRMADADHNEELDKAVEWLRKVDREEAGEDPDENEEAGEDEEEEPDREPYSD